MAAGYDGSIRIDTKINSKGFNTGISSMMSSLKGLAAAAAAAAAAVAVAGIAFGVSKLIQFGKAAVGVASDLQEVQNVVDVTFGDASQKINEFAKSSIENFGLSELSAKQYASTIGAMLKSSGLAQSAVNDLSLSLTGLTGDIASFYNLSSETAFQKIRAGLSGETEPLKQLGINLNVANLEAFALSQGITKSYDAMSQAEQVMLRYNYLISVTTDAQGDFVRTQDSWANQTRILSERFTQFKAIMGKVLMQTLVPFLKVLNNGISVLINFGNALATALGIENDTATSTASNMSDSLDDAVSSQEDLTSAIEDTTAAQEEQNRSIAAFDKLNDITKFNSSTSTSSGGTGTTTDTLGFGSLYTGTSTLEKSVNTIDKLSQKIKNIFDDLKKINLDNLTEAFDNLKTALKPFKQNLFDGLNWAYKNIFLPLTEWTIEDFLPSFLNTLSAALNTLNKIIEAAKPAFLWLWDNFLEPLANWTGGAIVTILGDIKNGFDNLSKTIEDNKQDISDMLLFVSMAIGFLWDNILRPFLNNGLKSIRKTLSSTFSFISDLIKNISELFRGFINFLSGLINGDFRQAIFGLAQIFASVGNIILSAAEWLLNVLASGLGNIFGKANILLNITGLNFRLPTFDNPIVLPRITVPKLATGAVIPANSEFLAVLGDQKSGRNLEAPESLIRQIVREESSKFDINDIISAVFSAIKMSSDAGLLAADVLIDGYKVGKQSAKGVGDEFNRSGFVLRTAKG